MKVVFLVVLLVMHTTCIVQARFHFHKNQKKTPPPPSTVSQTPAYSPAVPSDPVDEADCVFDVTDYGATGDGATDDTAAFVAAWKAACAVEGATLLVPSGCTFMITSTIFSGPCKPGLVFQVDGILSPPAGPDCWPKKDSNKQWLVFYKLNNMTLTGTGTIEGHGQDWWDLPCKPHKGPMAQHCLDHVTALQFNIVAADQWIRHYLTRVILRMFSTTGILYMNVLKDDFQILGSLPLEFKSKKPYHKVPISWSKVQWYVWEVSGIGFHLRFLFQIMWVKLGGLMMVSGAYFLFHLIQLWVGLQQHHHILIIRIRHQLINFSMMWKNVIFLLNFSFKDRFCLVVLTCQIGRYLA